MVTIKRINARLCHLECSPLERERVVMVMERILTFMYVNFELVPGEYRVLEKHVSCEKRSLYGPDETGQGFVFMSGMHQRLKHELQACGLEVTDLVQPLPKPEADWDRLKSLFKFRPGQEECLHAIHESDGGLIDAVPAFGKSWVISMICALYPKAKIDVVASSQDVASMLYDLISAHEKKLGFVNKDSEKRGRVTIYLSASLHKSDADADILLLDEVHEMATPVRLSMVSRYLNARIFGFSATTDTRADNAHVYLFGLCGPKIFEMDYRLAQKMGLVVPIRVVWVPVEKDRGGNPHGFVQKKRHHYWTNPIRNEAIARVARTCYSSGFQTLVIVDTVEHVMHLHKLLPEFEVCYSEGGMSARLISRLRREGLFDPEAMMNKFKRQVLRKRFEEGEIRGVIANTVWATGVSFDTLQVLIRADGGSSETRSIQTPGRVCRIAPDKEVGIVVDFIDCFNPWAWSRSKERFNVYKEMGWEQYDEHGNPLQRLPRYC